MKPNPSGGGGGRACRDVLRGTPSATTRCGGRTAATRSADAAATTGSRLAAATTASPNGGKDKLSGDGGKDRVRGGGGKDRVRGGGGKDKLAGGGGADRLSGGGGKDRIKSARRRPRQGELRRRQGQGERRSPRPSHEGLREGEAALGRSSASGALGLPDRRDSYRRSAPTVRHRQFEAALAIPGPGLRRGDGAHRRHRRLHAGDLQWARGCGSGIGVCASPPASRRSSARRGPEDRRSRRSPADTAAGEPPPSPSFPTGPRNRSGPRRILASVLRSTRPSIPTSPAPRSALIRSRSGSEHDDQARHRQLDHCREDGTYVVSAMISKPGSVAPPSSGCLRWGDARLFERMMDLIPAGGAAGSGAVRRPSRARRACRGGSSAPTTSRWFACSYLGDDVAVDLGGIVGKHVGDGFTAFFLAGESGRRAAEFDRRPVSHRGGAEAAQGGRRGR